MFRSETLPRATLAFAALALALVWLALLVPRHLAKTDEGRYAEIPREMLATGDWLTPRLDGLKYFEKPPLQYWATALSFAVFGPAEWSARLWTGLTGLAGIWVAQFTARRLFGPVAGWLAAAVLASSLLYFMMGHVMTLDMGLAFFMQCGLCAALLARDAAAPAAARRWMLGAWAALALAVLSKGPVGIVLPGAVFLLYLATTRDWAFVRRLEIVRGGLVFLVLTVPWFVAVAWVNPGFAHFFFIHEHVERFLTHEAHREGPWWYFFPVLALGLLPWLVAVPEALLVRRRTAGPAPLSSDHGRFRPGWLLVIWVVFIFLFFSASGSKLPSYILPVVPPLAMLIGSVLAARPRRYLVAAAVSSLLLALGLIALGSVAARFAPAVPGEAQAGALAAAAAYTTFGHGLMVAGIIWLCGALAGLVLARGHALAGLLTLAACSVAAEGVGLVSYDALDRFASAEYVAAAMRPILRADSTLYSVQMYEQTLPFYLGRTLTLVDERDELDFGLRAEPDKGIASLAAFAQRWAADAAPMAVMPPTTFATLSRMNLPMRVILSDRRFVVVVKS